jgi:hypothetical protein
MLMMLYYFGFAAGAAMAELIVDGAASCVDISAFDPIRYN